MALRERFPVDHGVVFSKGLVLVSPVLPVFVYDAGAGKGADRVQAREVVERVPVVVHGDLLWEAVFMDNDAELKKAAKTVKVTFVAKVPPVPPAVPDELVALGLSVVPVVLEGLEVFPYVESVGENGSRIAWSFRAKGMRAAGRAAAAVGVGKAGKVEGAAGVGAGKGAVGGER